MNDFRYLLITTFLIVLFSILQFANAENKAIRAQKDIFISTSIGGHLPTLLATPIKVGYNYNDLILELEYASRSFEYDKNDSITHIDGKIDNIGISSRWFFDNPFSTTFNSRLALNKRNLELNCQVEVDDEINASYSGAAKYTDNYLNVEVITLSTSLGNHWIWNNGLFVNIDWYMPVWILSSSIKTDVNVDSDINQVQSKDLKRAEDDLEEFGESMKNILGSNGYIILTFGWSF